MAVILEDGDQSEFNDDDIQVYLDKLWQTLNIPASRIVGKKSSGNIAALTSSEVWGIIASSIVTFEDTVVSHEGNVVYN